MSKKYIEDDYIELVEHYLYNDLPLSRFYKDTVNLRNTYNQSNLDSMLLEGEKYYRLDGTIDNLVATSLGRLLNTATGKQLAPAVTPKSLNWYVKNRMIRLIEIFKLAGWEFDFAVINKRYIDNNWKHSLTGYRRKLELRAKNNSE